MWRTGVDRRKLPGGGYAALQTVSSRPLVLRQVPLRGPDSEITGYVDLVSERAYRYRPGKPSDLIPDSITSVTVSVHSDAENSLRSAVLEFMDTVRRVEHAVAAGRRDEDVPEELDVLQLTHNFGVFETVLNKSLATDLETAEILLKLIKATYLRVE